MTMSSITKEKIRETKARQFAHLRVIKPCKQCGQEFSALKSEIKDGRRFCSRVCKIAWTKGKHFSPSTEIKRGQHLGREYEFKPGHISAHVKKGHATNTGRTWFTHDRVVGDKNAKWKGDAVGLVALHDWIKKQRGKATTCEWCGSTRFVQWANKSHEYRREVDDWLELCRKCHHQYDDISRKIWEKRRAKL